MPLSFSARRTHRRSQRASAIVLATVAGSLLDLYVYIMYILFSPRKVTRLLFKCLEKKKKNRRRKEEKTKKEKKKKEVEGKSFT